MNDDILALVLVSVFVAVIVGVVYRVVKKKQLAEKEYQEQQAKAYEQLAEMRRETTRKLIAEDSARVAMRNSANYNRSQVTPKTASTLTSAPSAMSYTTSPTQSVNTWSSDLLTTMVIADMLSNHKDVTAGTVSWKDDTPTVTETYSTPSSNFGMDDDDSRKSVSSSFSSSDSSSSWSSSDSSSSSSDSGPSSDW